MIDRERKPIDEKNGGRKDITRREKEKEEMTADDEKRHKDSR